MHDPKCNRHHGADEPCNNYGWSGCEPEGGYTTEDF